jgi:hypothetical protein
MSDKIDLKKIEAIWEQNQKAQKKSNFEQALRKEIQRKEIKKLAKDKPTKLDKIKAKVDEMETLDKYNKLTGKGKPAYQQESGQEAVDRLIDAFKKADERAHGKNRETPLPGVMEKTQTIKGKRTIPLPFTDRVIPTGLNKEIEISNPAYDPKGKKGSMYRIARERMDEIRSDIDIAQIAKQQGISFEEAKRNEEVNKKYKEYLKIFERPGVDKRKSDYLARLQTKNFFNK